MGPLAAPIERAGRPVAQERGSAFEFGQALTQVAAKMPRPQAIYTIMSKRFEDVITRPNPITPARKTQEIKVVEYQPKIDNGVEGQTVIESPQVRRRLTRLWIAVAVAALTTVSVIAFQALTKASYDVPELNGLAESQARNKIAEFGWEMLVQAERTNDVEFGNVIRTEPATGVSLKEGETIVLVVSEGPPLGVLIDVTGQTKEVAVEKIVAQGLVVASSEDSSETTPVGSVISWSVAKQPSFVAGDEVLKGTAINLTISNGPALRVVPLIVGLSLADATTKAA